MPGVEHVIEYHVVTKGDGWAAIVGEPPVRLEAGDIVMLPQGDPHVMSSAPGCAPARSDVEWFFATRTTEAHPGRLSRRGRRDSIGTPSPGALTNRRLRIPRLRPAAVQPAGRDAAAAAPRPRGGRRRLGGASDAAGGQRVAEPAPRRRRGARADERNDVRRRGAPLRRHAARREQRLARRAARSPRRARPRAPARRAGARLDGRGARGRGRRCRGRPCTTDSCSWSAGRRFNTSRSGGCRSRRGCCARRPRRSPPSRSRSVTIRRRLSRARSSGSPARRPRHGVGSNGPGAPDPARSGLPLNQ